MRSRSGVNATKQTKDGARSGESLTLGAVFHSHFSFHLLSLSRENDKRLLLTAAGLLSPLLILEFIVFPRNGKYIYSCYFSLQAHGIFFLVCQHSKKIEGFSYPFLA